MNREDLEQMHKSAEHYGKSTMCGYCKQYADIFADAAQALMEVDEHMEKIVQAKLAHPGLAALPELNDTMHKLKDKSEGMLTAGDSSTSGYRYVPRKALAQAAPKPPPASGGGGLLNGSGIFGIRGMLKDARGSMMQIMPRPGNVINTKRK